MFNHYYGLMSKEMRSDIGMYESLPKDVPLPDSAVREGAIRVIFKDNSWIRVYQLVCGDVEWY